MVQHERQGFVTEVGRREPINYEDLVKFYSSYDQSSQTP